MKARIIVTLKRGVLDPQGSAIENALKSMNFSNTESVRQGKVFDIELDETDMESAKRVLAEICEKLLANTVVEDYEIEI